MTVSPFFSSLPFSDTDLQNIIDKLANFVARNGTDFEMMTKEKQKNNPKFGFLFGGEYYNYYQYKVTSEQRSKYTVERNAFCFKSRASFRFPCQ